MGPRRRTMTEQAAEAAVAQACRSLRPPTIRTQFPDLVNQAANDQMPYRVFLAELLLTECDDRARRRSEHLIKAARFPRHKSLRAFDCDARPNIDPAVIHHLATCDWVKKGLRLCLIGDSGTGKSHLLIALATEAATAGYRVKYTLATKLANELVEAADEMTLTKTIARYDWPRTAHRLVDPAPLLDREPISALIDLMSPADGCLSDRSPRTRLAGSSRGR